MKEAGARLYVATSKPEPSSLKILERFELLPYFDGVAGSLLNETRTKKSEVLQYALEHFALSKTSSLMVGDRSHDVEGAAAVGLPCVGVLYGFGSRQELEQAGAAAIAEDVPALEGLLLRWLQI